MVGFKQLETLNKCLIDWNINYSVYPYNGYTINEVLMQFYDAINKGIITINEYTNLISAVIEWVKNEGLKEEVTKSINKLIDDGTLSNIINNELLGGLLHEIEKLKETLEETDEELKKELSNFQKNVQDILNNRFKIERNNINAIGVNSSNGVYQREHNNIYDYDKLRLLEGVYSYYGEQYYPSVNLDENGKINFNGILKITSQPNIDADYNMVIVSKIFHFDIKNNIGVPMSGYVVGVSDADFNDRTLIPCLLKTDGTLLIKNIGYPNKYYNRIELFNLSFNTIEFGKDVIRLNTQNKIKESVNYSKKTLSTLLFFSDVHNEMFSNNRYNMLNEVNYINDVLNPVAIVHGGDNIVEPFHKNNNVSRDNVIALHKEILSSMPFGKLVFANGNHDNNALQDYPNNTNTTIFPGMIKTFLNNPNFIFAGSELYYGYVDYPSHKTRIVVFDVYENDFKAPYGSPPRCSEEQILWHAKNSFKMPYSDWVTVIVSHNAPIDRAEEGILSNSQQLRSLVECYNKGINYNVLGNTISFSEQGRRDVPVWLYGHIHYDNIQKINDINYVSIAQSWCVDTHGLKRYKGTEKDCCIDIINIVPVDRKVYFTRVGAGENRFVTY
ncbi:metallophosphoesterase family protein [Pseudomonas sp.]|uniref:metallophosphoesterase family protein n=1 Tax=Pseudomonas sp. TaxID=306 RepID=UPI003FD72EFF